MDKKGQFVEFGNLAVGVVTLAILLVVALLIMNEGKDQAVEDATTFSSINQTFTITTNRTFQLSPNCVTEAEFPSTISTVYNGTSNADVVINAGNYTVTGSLLNISYRGSASGMAGLAGSVNISYSCKSKSAAYNATSTLQNATNDVPSWVPLLVLVVVGVVLLAIVQRFKNR